MAKKKVRTPTLSSKKIHPVKRPKYAKNKNLPLRERMKNQLKASRFRYINEQIYSSTGSETKEYFSKHPEEFEAYHQGYKQQIVEWTINPVDVIIKQIKRKLENEGNNKMVIADMGCGDAKISRSLPNLKVFSFDLVALNERITVSDMSNVFLHGSSVDIVVFCLSLMGTNLSSCIREANRILKDGGTMKIAEVESRFEDVNEFIKDVEKFGFSIISKDLSCAMFYFINFKKISSISKSKKKKLPELKLKPCLYKKR